VRPEQECSGLFMKGVCLLTKLMCKSAIFETLMLRLGGCHASLKQHRQKQFK
jgi:hypothetical protein